MVLRKFDILSKQSLGIVFIGCLALVGCAPTLQTQKVDKQAMDSEILNQSLFALKESTDNQRRVYEIGLRVLSRAAPLCANQTRNSYTITLWSNSTLRDANQRRAAQKLYNLGDQPQIHWVFEGSPADQAGLKEGDQIVQINKQDIPNGSRASLELINRILTNLNHSAGAPALELVVRRDGNLRIMAVKPAVSCDYSLVLTADTEVNAYADGNTIYVNQGIVDLAKTDDELAMVIGHELAHNTLGHISKKMANATMGMMMGGILDALAGTYGTFQDMGQQIGGQAFSPDFEREADYLGLYMTALAGYDYKASPMLWRRMARLSQKSISMTSSHPPTAERYVALEQTASEISDKLSKGLPLTPNIQ